MTPRLPLGYSEFKQLRRQGFHFVDKSMLVADVVRASDAVLLVPRPRRFGKTLNLSMLGAFLGRNDDDSTDVFSDLAVWQAGDDVRAHFRRYPVLALTLKDVKHQAWGDCRAHVVAALAQCAEQHSAIIDPVVVQPKERAAWQHILAGQPDNDELADALKYLTG